MDLQNLIEWVSKVHLTTQRLVIKILLFQQKSLVFCASFLKTYEEAIYGTICKF